MCILILHIHFITADSLPRTRNCSNELEPLLNLVFNQGKNAVLIVILEKCQISLEYETPHFEREPCDLSKAKQGTRIIGRHLWNKQNNK